MKLVCILSLLCLLIVLCGPGDRTLPGDICIDGMHGEPFGRGKMLSLRGTVRLPDTLTQHGRQGPQEEQFYVVAIPPEGATTLGGGTKSGNPSEDVWVYRHTETWRVQLNPPNDYRNILEKELTFEFDGRTKHVGMLGQDYELAKGNIFICLFDQNWQGSVIQINVRLPNDLPGSIAGDLRKRFPDRFAL